MRFQCRIGPFDENQGGVALSAPALVAQPSARPGLASWGRKPPAYSAVFAAVLIAAAGCATPDPKVLKSWKFEPVLSVKHSVPPSQAYYSIGRQHDAARAWDKAIEAYGKAVAADSRSLEAHNALGVALAQAGRHAEAEFSLRQAIAIDPGRAHVRSNLGHVLMLAARPNEAVVELKTAITLDAGNGTARANLRIALAQANSIQYTATTSAVTPITPPTSSSAEPTVVASRDDISNVAMPMTSVSVPAPISVAFVPPPLPTLITVPMPLQTALIPEPRTIAASERPTQTDGAVAPMAMRVFDQPTVASLEGLAPSAPPASRSQHRALVPNEQVQPVAMQQASNARQASMRLEVSNGNGVSGMAARVGRWLATQGLQTERLTNQQPFVQPQTVVQYRVGYEEAALRVARSLPSNAKADTSPTLGLRSDVRVVLGRDWLRTASCLSSDTCTPATIALASASSPGLASQ